MLPYPLYKQIVRFLLSGTLATLVHWSVFMCLGTGVFSLTINALFASSVGALCGAVVNYFLQYHLVFASQATYRQTLFPYLLSVSISFGLNALFFYTLSQTRWFSLTFTQVITTACVMVVNFILYKKVVFHEKPDTTFV